MNDPERTVLTELHVAAEYREEFLRMLRNIAQRDRAADTCVYYELYESTDEENVFILFQTWKTAEAFENYRLHLHSAQPESHTHMLAAPIALRQLRRIF